MSTKRAAGAKRGQKSSATAGHVEYVAGSEIRLIRRDATGSIAANGVSAASTKQVTFVPSSGPGRSLPKEWARSKALWLKRRQRTNRA